jgi:hypothetical protein
MASNHKLTSVLKGRTVTGIQSQGNQLRIGFDNGSTRTVQTRGSMSGATTDGTIKAVRLQGTTLNPDFEGGGSLEIQTAGPTASVMVRDKVHNLEHAE